LKRRNLLVLVFSAVLILTLIAVGCTQPSTQTPASTPAQTAATPTTTPTPVTQIVEKDKSYNFESPRGIALPVEIKALADRSSSLDGKTVYIVQGEADPVIMPALAKVAPEKYPKTTWVYFNPSSGFGAAAPEDEVKASADAVVRGISW
jgi:hypothetical protein